MGALLLSMMTAVVACLYMTFLAFKELDRAEQFLKQSDWIVMNKRSLGNGPIARVMRMLQIAGCLSVKNYSIRKGQLDASDVSGFPEKLERKIVWTGRVLLFSFIAMMMASYFFNHIKGGE
ncbi:hypothetical protein [Pseudomonas mangiferae]|uniref:Uncharacterized protein n=1 Tax=Pseudomonas mangiferae TaxID=2593654 RepID=A0A553GTB3_9PSED|nr:hypothetical protein [Pseudomonas mangiferae]TRX72741.1 hypothetical protein FM069_21265 [Pseudomonas mangiferae]